MRILGIDPSISELGYAVLDGGDVVCSGIIKTSSKNEYQTRIRDIYIQLEDIAQTWKPDLLAIETQFINPRLGGSVLKTTEVTGLAVGVALSANKDILVLRVNPKHMKSAIGLTGKGKRKEAKERSLEFVKEEYGIEVKNNNISDAICIAHVARKTNEENQG